MPLEPVGKLSPRNHKIDDGLAALVCV